MLLKGGVVSKQSAPKAVIAHMFVLVCTALDLPIVRSPAVSHTVPLLYNKGTKSRLSAQNRKSQREALCARSQKESPIYSHHMATAWASPSHWYSPSTKQGDIGSPPASGGEQDVSGAGLLRLPLHADMTEGERVVCRLRGFTSYQMSISAGEPGTRRS